KTKSHQSLSIDESKAVEWQLPKLNYDLVIVRVTAKSDRFSDGEQKYLPILPNKILVTETMPMTIRKNETRTFDVSRFVENWKNVETKNFTVEFATNPIWYAIQALPTVAEPKCENAIDYLSAYYVNRLANHIVTQNPKIKTVFTQWKKEKNSNALISNLNKNKELKNMQLEETPWVLDAENETQQKQQIATLFNLNEQQNNANHYLDKLFDLQNYQGGFSWIKGFSQSRYITQKILLQLARIERLTGKNRDKEYQANIKRAIRYLDLKIAEDFENLKKHNPNYYKQNVIGNTQLFYLHVRSEYPHIPIEKTARNAVNFYTGQAEKYWTDFTLYGKAMMALVNYRNKNQFVANEILTSLKENAMKTDELGMYWVKNRA
ncbi:MAG: alpha-2-macroglobulin, partial [Paludibacter sp.]